MRVCYANARRLMDMASILEERHLEHYVPMEYVKRGETLEAVPAVNNLIFIKGTAEQLQTLKQSTGFTYLRWIMRPVPESGGEQTEVIWVRDKDMEDFIRVTSERNQQVIYLQNLEFALKPGARVQVKEGPFAGVEGVVKSIKKHLCVVVPVDKLLAVAIMNVPKKWLIYLENK